MRISVFGLWHLGCVTAACVAEAGNKVVAIDTNVSVIDNLCKGTPPLFEPGLAELLKQGQAKGKLRFTTDLSNIARTDVLWVCHDIPVDEEDRADVDHVVDQIRATLPYLRLFEQRHALELQWFRRAIARDDAVVLVSALIAAPWDPWPFTDSAKREIAQLDIYTLRRILPKDRGKPWGDR
jgi:UDP-N-acetyl-D-mannosaminuronate dehydrogenase